MNPFGMCQTLEIKAKRELLKNEPPRKIKEICVLCKIDQIRILEKKRKKKNLSYLYSMQARKRRIEDCSQQILAMLIYPHTIRQHLPDS
jgi:hypothetical protein